MLQAINSYMPYLVVHTQRVKSMQAAVRHNSNHTHDAMLLYHIHHLLSSYHKIRYIIQNQKCTNAVQCTNIVQYNAKPHVISKFKYSGVCYNERCYNERGGIL
jgi:hypothetical protein